MGNDIRFNSPIPFGGLAFFLVAILVGFSVIYNLANISDR
jgi:hypothetical protein